MRLSLVLPLPLLLLLLLVGCDGADRDDPGDAGPGAADARADASPRPDGSTVAVLGRIRLAETRVRGPYEWAGIQAEGHLTAAGLPDWHSDVREEGDCRLRRYLPGSCVDCNGLCVAPAECRPYPTFLSGGEIGFGGLAGAVELVYLGAGGYYLQNQPPPDLFDAGSTVRVSAPGDEFAAFAVETAGVASIDVDLSADADGVVPLPMAADATFTWVAGGDDGRVRLTLSSQTQGHGLPATAVIECEGPDDGRMTVPGSLLAEFPATRTTPICVGVDCPPSAISRVSRGTSEDGTVELLVESRVEFWIDHP